MTVKALFARRALGSPVFALAIDNDGVCLKNLAATALITAFDLGAAVIVSSAMNVNSSARNNRFLKVIKMIDYWFMLALRHQYIERFTLSCDETSFPLA